MDTIYLMALYGPIIAMFVMGLVLALTGNELCQIISFTPPLLCGLGEILVVATIVHHDSATGMNYYATESDLPGLMMVQATFLLGLALLFIVMTIVSMARKGRKKKVTMAFG